MKTLTSRIGETKTVEEWQADCILFFEELMMDTIPKDAWERYQRVLGLDGSAARKPYNSGG